MIESNFFSTIKKYLYKNQSIVKNGLTIMSIVLIMQNVSACASCRGCCSGHGGVCCVDGVTMCCDQTPLSKVCVANQCDVCPYIPQLNMVLPGDVNRDGNVDLKDSVQTLNSLAKPYTETTENNPIKVDVKADVNDNKTIGLDEAIFCLQSAIKTERSIMISSFNIKAFGLSKANNSEVMEVLSGIFRMFHIVAVQEIRDNTQTVPKILLQWINNGIDYKYNVIIGPPLGRTSMKESYAYVYREDLFQVIDYYTWDDSANDLFHREPFIARFKVNNTDTDFVLIDMHVDPDEAYNEINSLVLVIEDVSERYGDENDFIILGDLNADCQYFNEDSPNPLKTSAYSWIISNQTDTTVSQTNCTYDRIISSKDTFDKYCTMTNCAGVLRFDSLFQLSDEQTQSVSDHYPVFFVMTDMGD